MGRKATGIVRRVDDLGRIVIPKEVRDNMNIVTGTPLEIFTENDTVIISKYSPGCTECGEVDVELVGKSQICKKCVRKLVGSV